LGVKIEGIPSKDSPCARCEPSPDDRGSEPNAGRPQYTLV